jgi:uncharacterized protein YndB with AHSA1/START domain
MVWRTITEPDQISQWFADRVDLVVEPGAHGYMEFGEQGGPVVVETADPPTRFSFPARRRLPMVEVDATTALTGPNGPVTLLDAFEGRRQLTIPHCLRLEAGHSDGLTAR